MSLEKLLRSMPVDQWRTKQVVVFDWYDGPREGVCCLSQPGGDFYFELLDERYNPDGLDDRLFRLSELPPGSVEGLGSALEKLGFPMKPAVAPVWRFPNEASRERADQQVQHLEAVRRVSSLIIWTRDMIEFLGCWTINQAPTASRGWFAALGVPQENPA